MSLMKKVGILTFHRALNYGAVLQTYALINAIKMLDDSISVEVIDYRCNSIERNRSVKSRLKKLSLKNIFRVFYLLIKREKFDKFLHKNITISNVVYNNDNLDLLDKNYDYIIVGSDQVWNYKITDSDYVYLLDFKADSVKKFSYAASLGLNEICDDEIDNYKSFLNDFCQISVRENNCRDILEEKMDIRVNDVHLDPTLLLCGKDWARLTNTNKYGKYILVYNVPKPNKLYMEAQKLSKRTGYKIISIPNGISPKNCKIVRPNVNEFLSLFKNAEYVITNSFHGTVFSLQFHRKFIVELQKNGNGNDRISTLLSLCNLNDHILTDNNSNIIYNDVNWDDVEKNLKLARDNSNCYLKNIITDNYKK